jgi:hypothetical protein
VSDCDSSKQSTLHERMHREDRDGSRVPVGGNPFHSCSYPEACIPLEIQSLLVMLLDTAEVEGVQSSVHVVSTYSPNVMSRAMAMAKIQLAALCPRAPRATQTLY